VASSDAGDTRLERAITPHVSAHPGRSGIRALPDAREAFAARALLAHAAERSLDVQYYIWRKDMTGTLLFGSLLTAADRGVHVRLLLDDNNTSGLDATLAALVTHPNVEVRLFNPFVNRRFRAFGYVSDFRRLNRRMHNKSFTADNQASIIGGRNVGDEYFGATEGVLFTDLDVLAVGPVVSEVSASFDRYWDSESSIPAERLLSPARPGEIAEVAEAARRMEVSPWAASYTRALRDSSLVHELVRGTLELEWASTHMLSDDPAKGLGVATPEALMPRQLRRTLGEPVTRLELVSPYFVPTAADVSLFVALAKSGVEIEILTNSLEATNVVLVHAGYVKRRKPLLKAGVKLLEFKRATASPGVKKAARGIGSSGSSLHAKTSSVDGKRVFIGSFNFDPRSAELNTEMGFVIDSPSLAGEIDAIFRTRVPTSAYEVRLTERGTLYWVERRGGQLLRHDREPGTSVWRRALVWCLSVLPIEWLL